MNNSVTEIEKMAASQSAAIYVNDPKVTALRYYESLKGCGVFDEIIVNGNAVTGLTTLLNLIDGRTTLFVTYQGTNDLEDWKSNFDLGSIWIPRFSGRAREGFYYHCRKTWRPVRNYIEQTKPEAVVFCGHSLGGAAAMIASSLALVKFDSLQNTIACVTFGAPRTFKADGADNFHELIGHKHTRFVMPGDPVPTIPSMMLYRHPKGSCVIVGDDLVREDNEGFRAWRHNTWNKFRGIVSLARHHSMEDYYSSIGVKPHDPGFRWQSPTEGARFI